jgi:hypothetical protein
VALGERERMRLGIKTGGTREEGKTSQNFKKRKKEDHDVEKERKEQPLEGYLKPCARWQSQRPIRDYGSL